MGLVSIIENSLPMLRSALEPHEFLFVLEPNTSTDAGDLDLGNFGKASFNFHTSVRTFSDNEIFL